MSRAEHETRENAGEQHPAVTIGRSDRDLVVAMVTACGYAHGLDLHGRHGIGSLPHKRTTPEVAALINSPLDVRDLKRCIGAVTKTHRADIASAGLNADAVKRAFMAGFDQSQKHIGVALAQKHYVR